MREIEGQISALKKDFYDDFTRPVVAFLTFQHTEGYTTAQRFNARESRGLKADFLGENMVIRPAPEPTNIIWEHRHFTRNDRIKRGCGVLAIVLVLLVVSFAVIVLFQLKAIEVNATYPVVQCSEIDAQYAHTYEAFAMKEYYQFFVTFEQKSLTGVLQCFCTKD